MTELKSLFERRLARINAACEPQKCMNALTSTSGGKSGGIQVRGLLLKAKFPGRNGGPLRLEICVTDKEKQVIPGAFTKDKDSGNVSQCQFDDVLETPESGQIIKCSTYLQTGQTIDVKLLDLVSLCGLVRKGAYLNFSKILRIGSYKDVSDSAFQIPKPWTMKTEGEDAYKPAPLIFYPHPRTQNKKTLAHMETDSGFMTHSTFTAPDTVYMLEKTQEKKLNGPFMFTQWNGESVTQVRIQMDLLRDANLEQIGIVGTTAWSKLASQFPDHLSGEAIMTVQNKENKSSSLLENESCDDNKYAVSAWCNYLNLDMPSVIQSTGVEVSSKFLSHHFDDEMMIESEDAAVNPLSKSTSELFNLNEWTGSLPKVTGRPDAKYYVVANFANESQKQKLKALDSFEERESSLKGEPGAKVKVDFNNEKPFMHVFVHLTDGPLRKGKRERN